MTSLLNHIICWLFITSRALAITDSIDTTTTAEEIDLMNSWEINFHKFMNNYVSRIQLVRPVNQATNRNLSANGAQANRKYQHSLRSTAQFSTSSTLANASPVVINRKNLTANQIDTIAKTTKGIRFNLMASMSMDQVTTIRPINVTRSNVPKNQSNLSSITTTKSTTVSPVVSPAVESEVDQVIYTPVECGRSFDEDWLHEGELNKLALYTNRQSNSLINEHKKVIKLDENQLIKTGSDVHTDTSKLTPIINSARTNDLTESSEIKSINGNLKHLIDRVDNSQNESSILEIRNYSENVNLNVERLIKNFNISTSTDTDLQMLKNVLINREEYHYYGEKRIINGQRANPGQFPWMASLQALVRYPHRTSTPSWRHICGASIINSHWLLTAAHCLEFRQFIFLRQNRPTLSVVVGSLSWNNSETVGQRYMVKDWRKYFEPFDALGQYLVLLYDIALIRLKTPIKFSNGVNGVGAVERICLPKLNDHHVNEELRVSGWGSITNFPKITVPKYMNFVDLPFVQDSECDKRYWPIRNSNRFICAGYLDDARIYGICLGDSGSPLVSKDINGKSVVVGIASGGRDRCGSGRFPATYAKVSMYRDWIKTITASQYWIPLAKHR